MKPQHAMSDEDSAALLGRARYGVLCTVGEDGCPYGTPVNYVRTADGRIFFHGSTRGERVSNISRDPRCCLTVVVDGGFEGYGPDACDTSAVFESVIVRGRVVAVEDDGEKAAVLRALVDAVTPERRGDPIDPSRVGITGVYEIVAESVTGKRRAARPGAVRFG